MDIVVLGATGHVGRELTTELVERGHSVVAVTRNAKALEGAPFSVAEVNVFDTEGLNRLFAGADTAFLLNPPADPSGNTDVEERQTAEAIVAALNGSNLAHVVAQSTWGVRPGHGYGDLSVLHHFEGLLAAQSVPTSIMRAAYLMSNWDGPIASALNDGTLPTMLPAKLMLPMVSPRDLARVAADLLDAEPMSAPVHVEGPQRCCAEDVVEMIAAVAGRAVTCAVVPRSDWVKAFVGMGFSPEAAQSYAEMTGSLIDNDIPTPADVVIGHVTLHEHVSSVINPR
jgi:uncharacterized protein YbjT (DUF2867 family)